MNKKKIYISGNFKNTWKIFVLFKPIILQQQKVFFKFSLKLFFVHQGVDYLIVVIQKEINFYKEMASEHR